MPATAPHPALNDLAVFERGWLSSNNVLLFGGPGEGATLVDSSHCLHAEQTVALVRHALPEGVGLQRVVNTHLHSDHCGGNAALVHAFGSQIVIPPGQWQAARAWDDWTLSYRPTGQRCERFVPDAMLRPGESFTVGARTWQAVAAPGHDPHALMLFDAAHGVLISADALWENGFGVVFPEIDGVDAFDTVAATLDLIERLAPGFVIPGHGAPFDDVTSALARARERLAAFRADPLRHARHAARVLLKYHVMEAREQPLPALREWARATPVVHALWQQLAPGAALEDWLDELLRQLSAGGALSIRDGVVADA